jgi:hypothetical protein
MAKIKVHRILEGPEEDNGYFWIVASTEQNGRMIVDEIGTEDLEAIEDIVAHLKVSIQPYELEAEWVDDHCRH